MIRHSCIMLIIALFVKLGTILSSGMGALLCVDLINASYILISFLAHAMDEKGKKISHKADTKYLFWEQLWEGTLPPYWLARPVQVTYP